MQYGRQHLLILCAVAIYAWVVKVKLFFFGLLWKLNLKLDNLCKRICFSSCKKKKLFAYYNITRKGEFSGTLWVGQVQFVLLILMPPDNNLTWIHIYMLICNRSIRKYTKAKQFCFIACNYLYLFLSLTQEYVWFQFLQITNRSVLFFAVREGGGEGGGACSTKRICLLIFHK